MYMKLLIFTASAGNGHNSAANRIKETFLSHNPQTEVIIIDGYKKYASPLKNWIQTKGYAWICNHGVKLYNHFFKKTETQDFSHPEKNSVHRTVKSLRKKMYKDIMDIQPDMIISTYIYCSIALRDIQKEYNSHIPNASLMLDYGISPFWECIADTTDMMFLTNDEYIKPFVARGFKKENLFPTGIIISNTFSELPDKKQSQKHLGLDENLFTLIIMKAGFFGMKEKDIIKNLSQVQTPIQVVIINGKAKKSKEKLDKLIQKNNLPHKIFNIGFTKEIPQYFACGDLILGKAGGLTTTESLTSKLPSLIVDNLPQQEIYNKEYMEKLGVAKGVNKHNLGSTLNEIVDNPKLLQKMKDNCEKHRILYPAEKMYDVLNNSLNNTNK